MNRVPPWCLGLATLLVLTVVCLWNYDPPVAGTQRWGIVFPSPLPVGTSEPIVVTGQSGAGDFLVVRYVGENSVVFAYDSWGHGGPSSAPIVIAPGVRHRIEIDLPSLPSVPGKIEADTQPVHRLRGVASFGVSGVNAPKPFSGDVH